MAMTLRTTEAEDQALERLAAHYGVSKQQAAAMAIRLQDAALRTKAAAEAQASLERWPHTYAALAAT